MTGLGHHHSVAHEIVYPDTIAAMRGVPALHGCLDEEAAYFWNHIAYCADDRVRAYFGDADNAGANYEVSILRGHYADNSPHIVHVLDVETRASVFTIRGSNTPADFLTVLDVTCCTMDVLLKRINLLFCNGTHQTIPSHADILIIRAYILNKVSRLPSSARIHTGIFMHAVKCLLMIAPHAMSSSEAIHLYGHSLGAACASLLYVWIRELRDLMSSSDEERVTCACMATPMFCNDPAWFAWFGRHDTSHLTPAHHAKEDVSYVHYYTLGDPFVKRVPGLIGLTKAVSTTHHVGPSIIQCQSNDASCSMKAAFLAHSCFHAGRFVRIKDSASISNNRRYLQQTTIIKKAVPSSFLMTTSSRSRILMSPKYTNPSSKNINIF